MYELKPWSFSSIKTYATCPRKYEAEKLTKEVPFTDSEATIYGKEVHKALEDFIKLGVPIPAKFSYVTELAEKLAGMPGVKYTEREFGVARQDGQFVSCDFKADGVWFRGIADLVIVHGNKAMLFDYKTGKSAKYADTRQLALMAACVFLEHPEVETIKAALLFTTCNVVVKDVYHRDNRFYIFSELDDLLTRREVSYNTGVFNATPNGLCKRYCGVTSCPHYGGFK